MPKGIGYKYGKKKEPSIIDVASNPFLYKLVKKGKKWKYKSKF